MFKQKDELPDKLEKYTEVQKYNYRFSILEHYEQATNGLIAFCFEGNKKLIIAILKIIIDANNGLDVDVQFKFAEKLFSFLNVDISNSISLSNYINHLSICLQNKLIVNNFDEIKEIYVLFENKSIVEGVIYNIIKNDDLTQNNIFKIIEYIKEARRFYVDEEALYSSLLSILKEIKINSNINKIIKKHLIDDKKMAGLNDFRDVVKRIEELETKIL